MSTQIQIAPKTGITIGTTPITNGIDTRILYQVGGKVAQNAMLTLNDTGVENSTTANFANTFKRTGNSFSIFNASTYEAITGNGAGLYLKSSYETVSTAGNNHNFLIGTGAPVSAMYINSSLNIGIGTTSPQSRLDVKASGALSTDLAFRVRNSADTVNSVEYNGDGSKYWRAHSGDMHFMFDPANNRIHLKRTGIYSITTDNAVTELALSCNAGNASLRGGSNMLNIVNGGNFHFEENSGTLATSGAGAIVMKNRTAPSTNVVDRFYMYSADIVAGNAAPHFRTENGSVIKLYKQDLPTSPTNAQIATLLSNLGLANLI